jgi:hypothetical protein
MAKQQKKVGRPSAYHPAYCETVIDLGKRGKSLAQMASHFDVARSTIDEWASVHPEFSEALMRAKVHSQCWWEDMAQSGLTADKFNAQVWSKSVQARFREDYTERQQTEHTGSVEVRSVKVNVLPAVMPPTVTGNGR